MESKERAIEDELLHFLEVNNWLGLEDEENAKSVVKIYRETYDYFCHDECIDNALEQQAYKCVEQCDACKEEMKK